MTTAIEAEQRDRYLSFSSGKGVSRSNPDFPKQSHNAQALSMKLHFRGNPPTSIPGRTRELRLPLISYEVKTLSSQIVSMAYEQQDNENKVGALCHDCVFMERLS